MATYTYDPTKLKGSTISRVRFELGDILVDGGAETCMLCDEEIQAVLDETPKFKRVLYKLADAVCMRLKPTGKTTVRGSASIRERSAGLPCAISSRKRPTLPSTFPRRARSTIPSATQKMEAITSMAA